MLNRLKNIFFVTLLTFSFACGSKSTVNDSTVHDDLQEVEVIEINKDNLKQSKKDLLEQIANDLYREGEVEIGNLPKVKMDETGIYDDIKPVDIEVDQLNIPSSLDLEIVIREEEVEVNPQ